MIKKNHHRLILSFDWRDKNSCFQNDNIKRWTNWRIRLCKYFIFANWNILVLWICYLSLRFSTNSKRTSGGPWDLFKWHAKWGMVKCFFKELWDAGGSSYCKKKLLRRRKMLSTPALICWVVDLAILKCKFIEFAMLF